LKLSTTNLRAGDPLTSEVDVKNTSQREGDEVVELYLSFPKSSIAPIRALRAFSRINLAPGETRHVQFTLDARALSEVNKDGDRVVAEGNYRIFLGGGQPGAAAKDVEAEFRVRGEQTLPE
jgi:beta-glucosidase